MLIRTPIDEATISKLKIYDKLEISGTIFTGRDAALPRLVKLIESGRLEELGIDLKGGIIFHTAVSPAGIGPTSSNKHDIETSIPALSRAGVKKSTSGREAFPPQPWKRSKPTTRFSRSILRLRPS